MTKTGKFATEEEKSYLLRLQKIAQSTPVIAFSSEHALKEGGLSGQVWDRLLRECHRIAMEEHGLPEIKGYYGLDEDNEFVTV